MVIEKLGYNYFHIYDTINGQSFSNTYLYYNKRDAVRLFKQKYNHTQRKRVEGYFKQLR